MEISRETDFCQEGKVAECSRHFLPASLFIFLFFLLVVKQDTHGRPVDVIVLITFYIPNKEDQKSYSERKTYPDEKNDNVHG